MSANTNRVLLDNQIATICNQINLVQNEVQLEALIQISSHLFAGITIEDKIYSIEQIFEKCHIILYQRPESLGRISKEANLDISAFKELCEKIYSANYNYQCDAFLEYFEGNKITAAIEEKTVLESFMPKFIDEKLFQAFFNKINLIDSKATRELTDLRMQAVYPLLKTLLSERESIPGMSKMLEEYNRVSIAGSQEDETDAVKVIFFIIYEQNIYGIKDYYLHFLTKEFRDHLTEKLKTISNIYCLEEEYKLLKRIIPGVEFQKMSTITEFLSENIEIATLTLNDLNISLEGEIFDNINKSEIEDNFRKIYSTNPIDVENIRIFLTKSLFDEGLIEEICSQENDKIIDLFKNQKMLLINLLNTKDGLGKLLSVLMSLQDGCVKNPTNNLYKALYFLLTKNSTEGILLRIYFSKIYDKIINSGGDIIGSESDPFKIITIIESKLLLPALVQSIQDSFFIEGNMNQDYCAEFFGKVSEELQNKISTEYILSQEGRVLVAKIYTYFLLKENFNEFLSCEEISDFANEVEDLLLEKPSKIRRIAKKLEMETSTEEGEILSEEDEILSGSQDEDEEFFIYTPPEPGAEPSGSEASQTSDEEIEGQNLS